MRIHLWTAGLLVHSTNREKMPFFKQSNPFSKVTKATAINRSPGEIIPENCFLQSNEKRFCDCSLVELMWSLRVRFDIALENSSHKASNVVGERERCKRCCIRLANGPLQCFHFPGWTGELAARNWFSLIMGVLCSDYNSCDY